MFCTLFTRLLTLKFAPVHQFLKSNEGSINIVIIILVTVDVFATIAFEFLTEVSSR